MTKKNIKKNTNTNISRSNLWLARPPHSGVSPRVWDVVCLAAIAALESSRRGSFKKAYKRARGKPELSSNINLTQSNGFTLSIFWERIAEFVAASPTPRWADSLLPNHPFISSQENIHIQVAI